MGKKKEKFSRKKEKNPLITPIFFYNNRVFAKKFENKNFTFTMSQKQQKEMSLETKLKILNEIDSGKLKKGELSINYGIAKSTISII